MSVPSSPARPIVVVALGGHAFIGKGEKGTVRDQVRNAALICGHLMALVERDYSLVITHGNGPQVGYRLLATERALDEVPPMPLDVLVAETEGSLGYVMQQALLNELRSRKLARYVVTMVTQVLVDPADPAFGAPSKPVGPFLTKEEALARRERLGWQVVDDAGRGWRRVVASPRPIKVIQRHMIRDAALQGHIVIAAGGGGIPVQKIEGRGDYAGIECVLDKDLTSAVLASEIGAELLVILTEVPRVYLRFGRPDQAALGAVTVDEIGDLIRQGHFPRGSMGPKVEAIHQFLQRGGKRGLITDPEHLAEALMGKAGTHFVGSI
jgi:carbamate kinase